MKYSQILIIIASTYFSYLISLLIGVILSKKNKVNIKDILSKGFLSNDPITEWFHKKLNKNRFVYINNKKWFRIFAIIFFNNLILVALCVRILWGIIFIAPYIIVVKDGYKHGIIYTKIKPGHLYYFEFGGLIFASGLGIVLGINILSLLLGQNTSFFVNTLLRISYLFIIVIVLLLIAGLIETNQLKKQNHIIPYNIDIEELKKKAIEILNK